MDTVPDVSNMEYDEAVDTLLAYLEDQDVSAGVHQL
jgi:beta-lactam-binding protein with PASTA domain